MIIIALGVAVLWMLVQGVLMLLGKYTPPAARASIENPDARRSWCKTGALINFGWAAVFAVYGSKALINFGDLTWLYNIYVAAAPVGAVLCAYFSYRNNRKHFKNSQNS